MLQQATVSFLILIAKKNVVTNRFFLIVAFLHVRDNFFLPVILRPYYILLLSLDGGTGSLFNVGDLCHPFFSLLLSLVLLSLSLALTLLFLLDTLFQHAEPSRDTHRRTIVPPYKPKLYCTYYNSNYRGGFFRLKLI